LLTKCAGDALVHEVLTVAEMRQVDAAAIAQGTPGITLMENAGAAVAKWLVRRYPAARAVLVLAGPGNNGGDGFVAARHLAKRGLAVRVALLGPREALRGDAALAAADWEGETVDLAGIDPTRADVVIDALFGAGLTRPLDGPARACVEGLAASEVPVVAVDVPSGLDGDGFATGGGVMGASLTVTFVRKKPGHLLLPGRAACGEVVVADIGVSDDVVASLGSMAFENAPGLWRSSLPKPTIERHKYHRGHVLVVSGPQLATGAARLAALGAFRAGAGLVTLTGTREALAVHAAHVTAIMLAETADRAAFARLLEDRRYTSVVIGPAAGVSPATRALVEAALEAGRALVMDADALTVFEGDLDGLARRIGESRAPVVLTPHSGEFGRLFAGQSDILEAPAKLEKARRAAARLGAVMVLKGADTVVAEPGGRACIAGNAPPSLATAGAGDVLAGMIGGLLAQGMQPGMAAAAAVWLHGAAAQRFGPGLIAEDLPGMLPAVLRELGL
jgi:hydroxyethylthiazole kinase-like uncharacterized protein yjeF